MDLHDNPYGLTKRVTSSEHVLLRADTELPAVFAFSEWKPIKTHLEQLERTRTPESADDVIERLRQAHQRLHATVAMVQRPEVAKRISDLDLLRDLVGDFFQDSGRAAAILGELAGVLMVLQAAAVARAMKGDDGDARVACLIAMVRDAEVQARARWDQLRHDLMARQQSPLVDAPFELVIRRNTSETYFRVPVVPESLGDVA